MIDSKGYAAHIPRGELTPYAFTRRDIGPHDILIDILYCGICHSDLHAVDDELGHTIYPIVPGHEIIGRVKAVGPKVTKFSLGDIAGVGCITDSCRHCNSCETGHQQFCVEGFTSPFNALERETGKPTHGGYSDNFVIDEAYALHIPKSLDPAAAAPLLCAGITTYAPIKRYGAGPGKRVGVLGLGGLGHLAIKFARAFGAAPVMLTSSPAKIGDAKKLGADDVILISDAEQMQKNIGSLDFILDTVSAPHDPNAYLQLLKPHGVMCLVGMPPQPLPVFSGSLIMGQKILTGSLIGGIAETQEMIDFSAKHNITADIEKISIEQVNAAYKRIMQNDVRYRFVIDMATLKTGQ